ncbi:hypothetical protein [Streptomyces sp. NPDC048202]|uniref:hypothetical protein n=1 Tax=Streptomyces sp. NPDC048202 TaxID=3365514 RepID=UPI0037235F46
MTNMFPAYGGDHHGLRAPHGRPGVQRLPDRGTHALPHEELRDTLLPVISADYETTVTVIDRAITAPPRVPGPARPRPRGPHAGPTWSRRPSATSPRPNTSPLRYALRDIPLPYGRRPLGEPILASYAAANPQPSQHSPSADTHPVKDHLAFGHGIHFCLDAPLTRLEAGTLLRGLLDRFPELKLAVSAEELRPVPHR